jgi:hypothetical protein
MCKFLLALFALFLFVHPVSAAIWINEISPSTDPEWIELYNDGTSEIDLTNWMFREEGGVDYVLSGSIGPSSYLVIHHADRWLNNSGDTLTLTSNASPSAIIDQYSFGSVTSDKSVYRSPLGSTNWIVGSPSQGSANPTPSPSPSPSPSPTPAASPSPSPTATPTPTPKPSPPSSPTFKPSPSNPVLSSPKVGTVAGESTAIDLSSFGILTSPIASPKPLAEAGKLSLNVSRAKTAMLVGTGLILTSVTGYFGYRKYKAVYNLEE